MKVYLMSSPNLQGFGEYSYKSISMEEASRLLKGGFVSAIRYQWVADLLRDMVSTYVPINRGQVRLEVGDSAVVIELPEWDQQSATHTPICIGLLTRTA